MISARGEVPPKWKRRTAAEALRSRSRRRRRKKEEGSEQRASATKADVNRIGLKLSVRPSVARLSEREKRERETELNSEKPSSSAAAASTTDVSKTFFPPSGCFVLFPERGRK